MASFMLASIGLKKFRSFQEPNRIDVLEKKTTTTHTTPGLLFKKSMTTDLLQDQIVMIKRLGAGPGVAGSVAESRASGGRLRSRSGGPEAKLGR